MIYVTLYNHIRSIDEVLENKLIYIIYIKTMVSLGQKLKHWVESLTQNWS